MSDRHIHPDGSLEAAWAGTLIAQADATEAPAAREAAIAEAKRRLEAQGADLSGFEIMQQQVTKVRFDGPYRAFVMVAAPKAK